jgi:hypothetical protein
MAVSTDLNARFAALGARIDAARKRCGTGYSCGNSCISLQKECRARPGSSISKGRIQRLQQLARGEVAPRGLGVPGQTAAAAMAANLQQRRSQHATELRSSRQARAPQRTPVAAITAVEIKRAFPLPTAQQRQQRDQLQQATNLAAAERQAVFDYSAITRGPRAASALNRCLRQPASCRQKKATAAMAADFDAALQKLPKNIEGAPFYRGIAVKDGNMQRLYQQLLKARPGERFADQGYGSYSDDRRVAAIYAEANGPAPAIVLVSRSQAITGISAISGYRKERESILPRGTAQIVRRVRRQGATIYVELD